MDDRVGRWLSESDTASVTSGVSGFPTSEFGDFDDRQYYVEEQSEPEEVVDEAAARVVEQALGVVARSAQRKTVCVFHRNYLRGRMLDCPDYSPRQIINQPYFLLESFMQLSSIDDPQLYEALNKGVVRTRLGAATGMGKTMRLPGAIASKCGLRVCQLELDSVMSKRAMKYQKKNYGVPGSLRAWSRQRKSYLVTMSYSEFRGIILSSNRDRLFLDFDVFYMDEAHDPKAVVWAAKQYFAAFSQPHNSLLVTSATISTNEDNNLAPTGMGSFVVEEQPLSLVDALDSGRLLRDWLVDRALLLVASDSDVAMARAYYLENGVDVSILDSASTEADELAVITKFSVTTSVVPRILIAHEMYGTGTNVPVTKVMTTCTRQVYELDSNHCLVEKEIPLMARSVLQHKGRTKRGLTSVSGGWLMSPDVAPDKEILASEAMEAYLSLVAASIKPRAVLTSAVAPLLPKGIDATVARMILRVGMPPALAIRYLGSDGRFAAKFLEGIKLFTQPSEILRKSKDQYPVGYDKWCQESVSHYYMGDETKTSVTLMVPFPSPLSLKPVMHAVSAVSEGLLSLDFWDWFDEEEESDDEEIGVRTLVKRKAVPRMPEAPEFNDAATVTSSTVDLWSYDADPSEVARRKKRQGINWSAAGEGRPAITTLIRAVADKSLGVNVAHPQFGVPEYESKVAYALPLEEETSLIPVRSAGGGKILLVSQAVHDCFMNGEALTLKHTLDVLNHLIEIKAVQRFVKSTVFDNWSPAWMCWFNTYADEEVVKGLKTSGIHSEAVRLIKDLYDRFRVEVLAVAASSNLYKSKLSTFVRQRPSVTKLVSAVRKGKLPIAQSDLFVQRVLNIKDAHDKAVMAIERVGIFAPELVTRAQAKLPLRDRARKMEVIDELVVSTDSKLQKISPDVVTEWRD